MWLIVGGICTSAICFGQVMFLVWGFMKILAAIADNRTDEEIYGR